MCFGFCSMSFADTSGSTNGHEWVDLGLPSGTLWATCNVGAFAPEEWGDYFAWGEKIGYGEGYGNLKTTFDWSSYKYCNGSRTSITKYCENDYYGFKGFTDNKTELDVEDDIAAANWGGDWRMPSVDQCRELYDSKYTSISSTSLNGVNGRLVTSKSNGNSIFLPAAGYRDGSGVYYTNWGYYWSRSLYPNDSSDAYGLNFDSGFRAVYSNGRYYGRTIRPVCIKKKTNDEDGIESVHADEESFVYDLQGRKMSKELSRGIYIVRGKKIVK